MVDFYADLVGISVIVGFVLWYGRYTEKDQFLDQLKDLWGFSCMKYVDYVWFEDLCEHRKKEAKEYIRKHEPHLRNVTWRKKK